MRLRDSRSNSAFTLVELLAVIAVVAILAALLIPAVSRVQANARTVTCASNLRQIHTGMMGYVNDNGGYFPDVNIRDNERRRWVQWWQVLNPYMGALVEDGFPLYQVQQCPEVTRLADEMMTRDDRTELPNYGMNMYLGRAGGNNNTTPYGNQVNINQVRDPAKTILAGDSSIATSLTSANAGLTPVTVALQGDKHAEGSNLLWVDGHVALWQDVSRLGNLPYAPGSAEDVWNP